MAGYFAIFLVVLTLASGLIWLIDVLVFAPKRKVKVATAQAAAAGGLPLNVVEELGKPSYLAETAKEIFPLILAITIIRSFLYEPFQIPSGSMMPTLLVGDFILVEKFSYDVKDPVWRKPLITTGRPERGDVIVFKYPEQPTVDFIKRTVGLPGDRIVYKNKQLFIQPACTAADKSTCPGLEAVPLTLQAEGEFMDGELPTKRYSEQFGEHKHDILQHPFKSENLMQYYKQPGTAIEEFIVPEGHYFALGDNRDNSRDSRFWGFVPEENLVGKAVFIWMSFEFSDDPDNWLPSWVPVGVRFERLGKIK